MPVTRSQTASQVKSKKATPPRWFPLEPPVAKTLGATAHLSIFCSSGEQPNRDARWHIQEDFKKALRVSQFTVLKVSRGSSLCEKITS